MFGNHVWKLDCFVIVYMTERGLAPEGLARWGLRTIAKLRSNSRFVNPMGCARYVSKKNRTG